MLYFSGDTGSAVNQATQKRLFLTTGAAEGLNGLCYFFIRSSSKAITQSNIANEVNFGSVDASGGKILDGFQTLLSLVMVPALKSQEVREMTENQILQVYIKVVKVFDPA